MPVANQVEEIQRDLACPGPGCQYNLRGLRGAVVNCPECGLTIDVARLIADEWKGSWWTVPGLKVIEGPVIFAAIALLFAVFAIAARLRGANPRVNPTLNAITATLWVVWLLAVAWVHHRAGGRRAVRLSLIALGFVPLWYALAVVPILGLGLVIRGLWFNAGLLSGASGVILLIVAAVLFWACRRGDRWLAEHCLRLYLARRAEASRT